MKLLSRLFLGISVLLAFAALALVIFVATFDANQYKAHISELVHKKTGREVQIQGNLTLSIYPQIAINLGAAQLSNAAGFGTAPFASITSAKVGVQLMPLLKKELKIKKIQLEGLQLDLHKKADGRSNWGSLITSKKAQTANDNPLLDDFIQNLSIAGIDVKNATLHWRDNAAKQDIKISPLNVKTGFLKANTPTNIRISGSLTQQTPALTATGSLTTTLTLSKNNTHVTLANTTLNANTTGLPVSQVELTGDIDGNTQLINIAGLTLHLVGDKNLLDKGSLQADLAGNAQINVEQQSLQLSGMSLQSNISNLPQVGSSIKTDIKGNTTLNLKTKQLHIAGMQLSANTQKVLANADSAITKINGDTQLDLETLLLSIKGMQLSSHASQIRDKAGNATIQLTGHLQADLKKRQLDINTMNLTADAKALPNIGNITTKATGTLKADITQQHVALRNARINTSLNGAVLSGGTLAAQLTSSSINANAKTQHLKLAGMNLNATLNGGMIAGGKLVHSSKGNVDVNLSSQQGQADLSAITLELAGAKLTGSAKLTQLSPKPSITGTFKTNQFNLKQLLNTLGVQLPKTSKQTAFAATQAHFNLTATPDNVSVRGLKMRMDQSNITGDIAINNFQQAAIKTKLTVDQFNLDDYLAPVSPQQNKPSNPNDKLLPIDLLKTLNLNGAITIGKLRFDNIDLSQVRANLYAKKGIVRAKPLQFNAFKGNYNGDITINATTPLPIINMNHKIQQVRSENVLLQFFEDRYVSGGVFLNTRLNTRGNTLATIKQNLQGNADIEFREGTIRDSKLAQKLSLAVQAFEKKKTNADGKQVVTFTKLGGDWKASKGVFTTNNLQLLAPHFLITGKGNIDIAKNAIDLKLRLGSKNKDSKIFAPLHIHGPFDTLNYDLELDVLLKSLTQEEIDNAKAKLKQTLLDEKAKALQKLEERKQQELQRLQAKKEEAQNRLRAEQDKLKQRLQDEKAKAEQRLQNRLQQEQDKLNNAVGDKLEEATGNATEDIKQNLEDELKNKLKGFF